MGSIGKKNTVMINGHLLCGKEVIKARKITEYYLNGSNWGNISDLQRMLGHKVMGGTAAVCTKNTVMKLKDYYQKEHPGGYMMEHKRIGNADYFRIVKVGTEE